ncbi:hypothetical protein [Roseomonas elaeocarpi]|uniref:Uncharacterized protein n=1 Tax=Roseomonas elaeocarpi TaxID=907779 RepID=A0ABV6JQN2_9PROT
MADETKTDAPADPPYRTGAEVAGMDTPLTVRENPSLSFSPDLTEVPGSTAPSLVDGTQVAHVQGPQQAAVDPVAAGLDTGAKVATTGENRAVTRTGEIGAGQRPATYIEKGQPVDQAAPADNATVPAPSDAPATDAPPAEETPSPKAGKKAAS